MMNLTETHKRLPATISQHYYVEGLSSQIQTIVGDRWNKTSPIVVVLTSGEKQTWDFTKSGKWELRR